MDSKELIASKIRDVMDFPAPGVVFKDITPLLGCVKAFETTVEELAKAGSSTGSKIDYVVGMEARGFIFAPPVALKLGAGFVPVRKPGKLPCASYSESFDLEYGTETLTIHQDAIPSGSNVLVIDDVMATGGTVLATQRLLERLGANLVHVGVVMELASLKGRETLSAAGIDSVSSIICV